LLHYIFYLKYNVVCDTKDTRSGFKHIAILHRNGFSISKTKICYLNRTWERFTYESVLRKIIDNYFSDNEKLRQKYLKVIDKTV
jgi:hypothetical protein